MTVTAVMSQVGLHQVLPSIAWIATRNVRFIRSMRRKMKSKFGSVPLEKNNQEDSRNIVSGWCVYLKTEKE
jgi:uncharacterized alkaline shock family protein YloU